VPAVSQESFEQAYREVGRLLRIPGIADARADVKKLVKARLSDEDSGQWLIVVDNANVLFGPLQEVGGTDRLTDYLPHSRKGSIVFTTRTRKAAVKLAGGNHIQLNELEEAEARKMLEKHVTNTFLLEDDEVVHEFLEFLTYLPLAIVQAAAFVIGNNIRLSEYINIYTGSEQDAIDLLGRDFEDQGRYRQIQNPVAITWYISFRKIQEQDILAAEYLSLMACTTGEAVPESLLWLGNTKLATTEALGTLSAYAFIAERQQEQISTGALRQERTFDMHRLVRLATRNWLQENGQWQEWVSEALARLVEIVPFGVHETREAWTTYLPHAIHVIDMPELSEAEGRMSLLDRIGCCEETLGRYRAAEQAYWQVLKRRETVLGKEHPDTLGSMNDLANTLSSLGKYVDAEAMHRETLALQEKVLGKEHPNTLSSLNHLALALSSQGKYTEAEAINREALSLHEKVLGTEDPATLASMNHLAHGLSGLRKYAEAEAMYRETLAFKEKVLEKEHPATLTSMHNLAYTLGIQGKYVEAVAMHQETLTLQEKAMGMEHPDTLTSTYYLARLLQLQHQYQEASQLYERAYTGPQNTLGPSHRSILKCFDNYTFAQCSADALLSANKEHKNTNTTCESGDIEP
jgi:tetratricopeptide (TPR) repeat protein